MYNWIYGAFMSISKAGIPFKVAKEMHPSIIQALINVCSKTRSSIMDLSASIGMCSFSKNSFIISTSIFLYNHLSPYRQHILSGPTKALGATSWIWSWIWRFLCKCWSLSLKWPHLSLMPSLFTFLILTLLSRNVLGGCLIMSKLSTCINIMHSFSSFCCMPHIFLSLYLQSVVSTKELPFIWGG